MMDRVSQILDPFIDRRRRSIWHRLECSSAGEAWRKHMTTNIIGVSIYFLDNGFELFRMMTWYDSYYPGAATHQPKIVSTMEN